ncbi:fimbrial protein [Pantoea sp. AS142]|uniref:fimbrial protein n=1 Tax=Pantoea sp. AS142 TaxID=3081292 RepID=UPI0030174F13
MKRDRFNEYQKTTYARDAGWAYDFWFRMSNTCRGISPITINPGASTGTQGAGGCVPFTGETTAISCAISRTRKNQIVNSGKWAKTYFEKRSETTETPFTISVKDWPSSVKTVAERFDGDKDGPAESIRSAGTAECHDRSTAVADDGLIT